MALSGSVIEMRICIIAAIFLMAMGTASAVLSEAEIDQVWDSGVQFSFDGFAGDMDNVLERLDALEQNRQPTETVVVAPETTDTQRKVSIQVDGNAAVSGHDLAAILNDKDNATVLIKGDFGYADEGSSAAASSVQNDATAMAEDKSQPGTTPVVPPTGDAGVAPTTCSKDYPWGATWMVGVYKVTRCPPGTEP